VTCGVCIPTNVSIPEARLEGKELDYLFVRLNQRARVTSDVQLDSESSVRRQPRTILSKLDSTVLDAAGTQAPRIFCNGSFDAGLAASV